MKKVGGSRLEDRGWRIRKIVIIFCLSSVLYPLSSIFLYAASRAGTTSASFLTLDVGARGIGMAGAYTAATNDINSIYWNPAGLALIKKMEASLMRASYIADTDYQFAAYGMRVRKQTVLGGGFYSVDHGAITQTDISGNTIGSFQPKDSVYAFSVAEEVQEFIDPDKVLYMGFSIKHYRSQIVKKVDGNAYDAGLLLAAKEPFVYKIGIAFQNFGSGPAYDQQKSKLPTQLKIGGAVPLMANRLMVTGDVAELRNSRRFIALGVSWSAAKTSAGEVALRGGFNSLAEKDLGNLAGLNAGVGFEFRMLAFDYAFSPMGELGASHRLSLTLKW